MTTDFDTTSSLPPLHGPAFRIPGDLSKKYEVETLVTHQPVEQLLRNKIVDNPEAEAFYIVNLATVIKKYHQWVGCLPRVKPYYAIKCNPNNAIIKVLSSLGVNFDCASKTEIQQILGSSVPASRIIFANPCKTKSHILYAKSSGVDLMTFDNSFELNKIAETFPNARLILRIITDDSQSVCRFSTKFGCPLDKTMGLLLQAKELGLNVVGISFHVGSGCMSTQSFNTAIRSAHKVFAQGKELGFNFNLLDLGGGWPGSDEDAKINFTEIATAIRPTLDELFPEGSGVELIAEPGRYFVAQSHTLAVNVFGKRCTETVKEDGTVDKHFLYYVNDGVYQSFNCIFFDHVHPTPLVLTPNPTKDSLHKCTIFGPTCDSMDCIAKDIMLPELEVDEWLYFKDMGAYTVAAASPFNGFKSSPSVYYIVMP